MTVKRRQRRATNKKIEAALDYAVNKHKQPMIPQIKIIEIDGRRKSNKGDLLIGTSHKYLRISDDLAELLGVEKDGFVLFGSFGEIHFVAAKPRGMFGGIQMISSDTNKSLHSTSHGAISKLGKEGFKAGIYNLEELSDKNPIQADHNVDGKVLPITWYRLSYVG